MNAFPNMATIRRAITIMLFSIRNIRENVCL